MNFWKGFDMVKASVQQGRGHLLFLDMDDVLCINSPYGGYDVMLAANGNAPTDLWERLFSPVAVQTLLTVMEEFSPRVVLTTSWIRFFDREAFETIFHRTGLREVAQALHEKWDAEQQHGQSRADAIERWLAAHHTGESFAILDDDVSGTGLMESRFQKSSQVIFCQVGVGLVPTQLEDIRKALR